MEKKKKIYLLRNKLDGMEYIGQTSQSLSKRCQRTSYKLGTKIREAMDRDGQENFTKELLEEGLTQEEANIKEQYYINERNTLWPNGYNLQSGGKQGTISHELSLQKFHKTRLGHEVSKDTREKLSEKNKGQIAWNKGRKGIYSQETLKKMSESRKGYTAWNRKRVIQKIDGQIVGEYSSVSEAAIILGLNAGNIAGCCRGERKSAGGSMWEYA